MELNVLGPSNQVPFSWPEILNATTDCRSQVSVYVGCIGYSCCNSCRILATSRCCRIKLFGGLNCLMLPSGIIAHFEVSFPPYGVSISTRSVL
jgi:hypothetical protein